MSCILCYKVEDYYTYFPTRFEIWYNPKKNIIIIYSILGF